jgi:hypothetical protein
MKNLKFYLILPVLVTPFLVMGFWLMGGGMTTTQAVMARNGLNASLPSAVNNNNPTSKFEAYEAIQRDTAKKVELRKQDPNLNVPEEVEQPAEVYESKQIYRPALKQIPVEFKIDSPRIVKPDPEMEAINQALDKLIAIQQPEKEKQGKALPEQASRISAGEIHEENYFGRNIQSKRKGFFADGESKSIEIITAVIPTEQVLKTGSVVKLELQSNTIIQGNKIPAGSFLSGYATINGERLMVQIPSMQIRNNILPVSLVVYDLDGLEGIYVPGSVEREVVKQSAESAIGSTGMSGFDMSLKTQAMSAGVGAAKSLLTKKVKQERVTIAAGYHVLLVNKNMQ